MKKEIIDKIIQLRYGCAVLESRGHYSDTKNDAKELQRLYKKYPQEYQEAEKKLKKNF